jgi:hypothetical protein
MIFIIRYKARLMCIPNIINSRYKQIKINETEDNFELKV